MNPNDGEIIGPAENSSRELVNQSGNVYLPKKNQLKTASEDFDRTIEPYIPSDIAAAAINLTKEPRYSPLQMVAFATLIFSLFLLLYIFFPKPPPLRSYEGVIEIPPPAVKTRERYESDSSLRKEAYNLLQEKQYDRCAEKIQSVGLEKWMKNPNKEECRRNTTVVYDYLCAVYRGNNAEYKETGYKLAMCMKDVFPDEICWRLFIIALYRKLNFNNDKIEVFEYKKIWIALAKNNPTPERTRQAMDTIRSLKRELEQAKRIARNTKDKNNLELLDVKLCQLLTTQWVVEGKEKKYPDDNLGDPGVAAREEAYEIAKKYENQKEMLQARLFIVDKLLATVWGYYYWNGERKFLKRHLEDERTTLINQLSSEKK